LPPDRRPNEYNGDRLGPLLQRSRCGRAADDDHVGSKIDQIIDVGVLTIDVGFAETHLQSQVAAFVPSQLHEPLPERRQDSLTRQVFFIG
jgi:hypothetical protein